MTVLKIALWTLAVVATLLTAKYLKGWIAVIVAVIAFVANYYLIPFALSDVVWSNRWLPHVMAFFVYFTFLLPYVLIIKVALNRGLPYISRKIKTSKANEAL